MTLVERLRDSATKVMKGVPRDQLLQAADEIERLSALAGVGVVSFPCLPINPESDAVVDRLVAERMKGVTSRRMRTTDEPVAMNWTGEGKSRHE